MEWHISNNYMEDLIMNSRFVNTYVLNILKLHGWYEDRKINISQWIKILGEEGYVCFDYAIEVMQSLGGISVNVDGNSEYMGAQFDFDPVGAGSGEYDRLANFELYAKESLYPVAYTACGIIYVGESKNVYGGNWKEFYWDGNNIEDYLNRTFVDKLFQEIKILFRR